VSFAIIGLREQLGTCFVLRARKYHHSIKSSGSFEVEKMAKPKGGLIMLMHH
jgi:hypothetical protein